MTDSSDRVENQEILPNSEKPNFKNSNNKVIRTEQERALNPDARLISEKYATNRHYATVAGMTLSCCVGMVCWAYVKASETTTLVDLAVQVFGPTSFIAVGMKIWQSKVEKREKQNRQRLSRRNSSRD